MLNQLIRKTTWSKWMIVLLFILSSININSQNFIINNRNATFTNYGKDESSIRKYLEDNYDYLSSIEGIWSVNTEATMNGQKASSQGESQVAIVRNSKGKPEFLMVVIERTPQAYQQSGTRKYDIVGECSSTSQPNIYLSKYYKGKTEIVNFPYSSNLRLIRDGFLTSEAEYYIGNMYCTQSDEYIKIFPLANTAIKPAVKVMKHYSGTGFSVNANGYILTNFHVVENASKIFVRGLNADFAKKYEFEVFRTDKRNDLALIKIIDSSYKFVGNTSINFDNRLLELGESVNTLGFPMTSTMGEQIKYSNGSISSKSGFQDDITNYQCSLPLQPGNSGGPLFDKDGNIVGIISAKHRNAENTSYAVKCSYILNFLTESGVTFNASKKSQQPLPITQQIKKLSPFVFIIETEYME